MRVLPRLHATALLLLIAGFGARADASPPQDEGIAAPAFESSDTAAGLSAKDAETPRTLHYDGTVGLSLFAGALLSAAVPADFYKTPPPCRWCDAQKLNAVDRWARKARWEDPCSAGRLSYGSLGLATAVALVPMSREKSAHEWLVNAGAVVDSVAVTVILTQAVKYAVRRERPADTTCHPDRTSEPDRNLSFFSGHTAVAFALIASAHETSRLRGRPRNDWLWLGGASAVATGYLRVAGDRHYLIDVVTGAGVGYLVGRLTPRHLRRSKAPDISGAHPEWEGAPRAPTLALTKALGADRGVLLQVGKGPGRSLQVGIRF